jgi:hypothetical protein
MYGSGGVRQVRWITWYLIRGYVNDQLVAWRTARPLRGTDPGVGRRGNLSYRQRSVTDGVFLALYTLHGHKLGTPGTGQAHLQTQLQLMEERRRRHHIDKPTKAEKILKVATKFQGKSTLSSESDASLLSAEKALDSL